MYENEYGTMQEDYGYASMSLSEYTADTFRWMAAGLMVTFLTAYVLYRFGIIYTIVMRYYPVMFIVAIAEIILVAVLSARIDRMSVEKATGLFFGYAILNGLTFGVYLTVYATSEIFKVFLVTSVFFGIMAVYGKRTETDLTKAGPMLLAGSVGLLVFWILSMFLNFSSFERTACLIGVVIFMTYTAFDVQKIRHYYDMYACTGELLGKTSIISALGLYLDFINLFLYILRIMGNSKRK